MARPKSARPTDAEMEILRVLWLRGACTVRDVQDEVSKTKKLAYTSLATIMRIMVDKELVKIVEERRPQKFEAVITESQARKSVTDEWLTRMFGGSVLNLVRHALTGRRLPKKDIEELKKLIESAK